MSVFCKKMVVHFKSESVSKVIQISFKTDSDLSQNWLRSHLLIQIWISFKSNLNHIWNWLGLEMYNCLDEEYWHLQRNGFTVPEKHFGAIYIYPLGIIFLSRVKVVFAILGFQARCIRSFGALLDLELQENDNIIFWKNLNKGSIWSPFPRTWLLGARFRCHGSVSRKPGSHFPVIDNTLQHEGGTFQVWVKTNSGLIQNWFWSDSKLIEIWFKTDSDLIKNCFKLVQILFKTEFGCPFTLLIMHAVERRLWHF